MKKKTVFQIIKITFFLGIGVFSIWWFLNLLTSEQKKEIIESFSRVNYFWIIISMLSGFIAHYIRTIRWKMIIKPLGFSPSNIDTFAAVSIGYLGNFIIPRFGEIARCYSLKKTSNIPASSLLGTVIVERIIDLAVFFILFIFGLAVFLKKMSSIADDYLNSFIEGFTKEKILVLIIAFILICISVFIIYKKRKLLKSKPLFSKFFKLFSKFKDGLLSLLKIKQWPLFILYTILIWILYVLMSWLCFLTLTETMHLSFSAAFATVAFGTIGIIVVQGGIGVYPAIVSQVLVIFGISTSIGYAIGWITWIAQTLILIIMGIWALAYLIIFKGIKINDFKKN